MSQISFNLAQALNRAVSAYQAGNLVEVEQLCQDIISINHELLDAFYLLAVTQSRLGKNHAALLTYDRVLALRPDFAEAHYNRGDVLQAQKRYDEALASFDRALDLRPEFVLAHYNCGDALLAMKRFEEAVASYDCALALCGRTSPRRTPIAATPCRSLGGLRRHW